MNDLESVKVSHARCDFRELKVVDWWRGLKDNGKRTRQLQAVCLWIRPRVLLQSPVGHPLREDAKPAQFFGQKNSQERQDVWVG